MNAKGVILKAFERYRLKTCIDFKPWSGEANYISSRSDRDDYVTIVWDRILSGREHNFNIYSDRVSDSLNVPYDYTSVMHYSKTAFQNGTEPTIVTRISNFEDVIGQRMDFSDYDLLKLNRLYNCSSSLSFMDSCDFELENICDSGFFMHFDTSSANEGATAMLESRMLYPKRGFQCLEFYLYNSGSENNQVKIYTREFTAGNPDGVLTLQREIQEIPTGSWQLYYVTLQVTEKFRVAFEGLRGPGPSSGGLSIDDINLSETNCPHHIWRIQNFTQLLGSQNTVVYSPPYYSPEGYAYQVSLNLNSLTSLGIYFHLISGANDDQLQWPCPWQQATMTLLDQNPDIRQRMSNQRSISTDPTMTNGNVGFFWDRPSKVGNVTFFPNGTQYNRNRGYGTSAFITYERLKSREFVKGDDVYSSLLPSADISHLNSTSTVPVPTSTVPDRVPTSTIHNACSEVECLNGGICTVYDNRAECR
ncbi:Meprin A subunit beta [Lemmus lemmus]